MGNARFHKTGNGGIKFKRKLSVAWTQLPIASEADIVGSEGTFERAYSFGTTDKFSVHDCDFSPAPDSIVASSLGRSHKVVSGPFFSSPQSGFSEPLINVTSRGAWCPNLPLEERILVFFRGLKVDNMYEARLVFSCGKKNGSSKICIDDNSLIDVPTEPGSVAVAKFIATKEEISVSIRSLDASPPFINAVVLRSIGFVPSVTATIILS